MRDVGDEDDGVALGEVVLLVADGEVEGALDDDEVLAGAGGVGVGVLGGGGGEAELVELELAAAFEGEERPRGERPVLRRQRLAAGPAEDPGAARRPGRRHEGGEGELEGAGQAEEGLDGGDALAELDLVQHRTADAREKREALEGQTAARAHAAQVVADGAREAFELLIEGRLRRSDLGGRLLGFP